MKKYNIKTTDVELLKKWYYLMTLGRALDEKAPAYCCSPLAGPFTLRMPDMTGYSWPSDRYLPKEKTSFSLTTVIC